MIKISLVFPYSNFFDLSYNIFQEHNEFELDYGPKNNNAAEYILEEIVISDNKINKSQIKGTDVIISRGITSELIKNQVGDIPVVEIPVVGNDLVRSLYEAKQTYGRRKVAVIGSQNMIYGVEGLSEIVDLDISSFIRHSNEDGPELVSHAIDKGCEVIISGVDTCIYARSIGLDTIVIKTGKESFWQALSEAKKVAYIHFKEQEKSQRFKAILDYAYEGIIALNRHMEITTYNSVAKEILSIQGKDFTDLHIDNIIPDCAFRNLIHGDTEYLDKVIKYKNINLTVNKVPILVKDDITGYVITFQDITGIQKMEENIRRKTYARGHIAKYTFDDILGNSKILKNTIKKAKQFSGTQSDILITGNSGTGKELFAQGIHNHSNRKDRPFVAVNCSAIPENLLESELFGYVKGAFTGANKNGKPGFFELAHGGTIFLDEIAEITPKLQCRLLRVLQEREVMRLGDDKIIPVNIRVIAATNKNLFQYVKENKFREDLYYRLDVLTVRLPTLNERKGDIGFLASIFIRNYSAQFNKPYMTITDKAKNTLENQVWHGNIRQLKNICQRLVLLNESQEIDFNNVMDILSRQDSMTIPISKENHIDHDIGNICFQDSKEDFEKKRILKALEKNNYNRTETAKFLGISRTTLWKQMKKFQ